MRHDGDVIMSDGDAGLEQRHLVFCILYLYILSHRAPALRWHPAATRWRRGLALIFFFFFMLYSTPGQDRMRCIKMEM